MTDRMERIRRISRLLYLLCIVIAVVLAVLAATCVIMGSMPDLSLFDDIREYAGGTTETTVAAYFGAADMALMAVLMGTAAAVFREISESHTPFVGRNSDRIMLMGHVVMFMAIAMPIAKAVASSLTSIDYHLDVARILMMVIIAVMAYCVALIFDYGAQLQKESDETL